MSRERKTHSHGLRLFLGVYFGAGNQMLRAVTPTSWGFRAVMNESSFREAVNRFFDTEMGFGKKNSSENLFGTLEL